MVNENQLTSTANASFYLNLTDPINSPTDTPIPPVEAGYPVMDPEAIQRGGKKRSKRKKKSRKSKSKSKSRSKSKSKSRKSKSRSKSKSKSRSRRGGHCGACGVHPRKKKGGSGCKSHRKKRSKKGKKKRGGTGCGNHR